MVEFTEADSRQAAHIVEGLLSEERPTLDLQEGLSVADVERDSDEFLSDLDLLSVIGADFPALRVGDGESVPVSLSLFGRESFPYPGGIRRAWRYRPYIRELLYEYYYGIFRDDRGLPGFERLSREQARSNFLGRARDFLASRLAAIRYWDKAPGSGDRRSVLNMSQRLGGPQISVSGCLFSVSTNSVGLRVFWSGAYYISANYFGHPTYPVTSVLQSGIYVFGVDGGAYGSSVQWDKAAVCTLPGKPSVHLNY
jgi:hypothetical protein